jgi:hypothetical protein
MVISKGTGLTSDSREWVLPAQDGVVLGPPGFPRTRRNFLMPPEDCALADQFIRHYFTLYDCGNRRKLEGLYHSDALFSLTATYLSAQSTSNTARSVTGLNIAS